jgi:hypothetical protein
MKLSELTALAATGTDPEILILRDWGELSPAAVQDTAELADGDPVIDLLANAGDSIILVASNIDEE